MTIKEFCERNYVCIQMEDWALSTGCETIEELWKRDDIRPDWRILIATRPGVLTEKELRLFAVFCAKQCGHLLTDNRSMNVVDVAERYANGNATIAELNNARAAASAVASAARAAARSTAYAAAVACDAAYDATDAAACDAAYNATDAAAWAADAAAYAAKLKQAQWLIENTKPNFNTED